MKCLWGANVVTQPTKLANSFCTAPLNLLYEVVKYKHIRGGHAYSKLYPQNPKG